MIDEKTVLERIDFYKQKTQAPISFDFNRSLRDLRNDLEHEYFIYHIAAENNNMTRIAQKVGLERTHLYRKLKALGLK
jgi:DNA-binding NtrC family response regulator